MTRSLLAIALLAIGTSASPVYASDIDPRAAARQAGNSVRLTPGTDVFGNTTVNEVVTPFEGTNVPETTITGSNIEARRNQAVADGGTSSQVLQTITDSNALRPARPVAPDNPGLAVADYAITNKHEIAGHLFSGTVEENPACNMENFSALEPFERFCEMHSNLVEETCQIDRVVEVDRVDTWQCDITSSEITISCTPGQDGTCNVSDLPEGNPQNQCEFLEERCTRYSPQYVREPATGDRMGRDRWVILGSMWGQHLYFVMWDGVGLGPGTWVAGTSWTHSSGWTYHIGARTRVCDFGICSYSVYRTRQLPGAGTCLEIERDYICPDLTQCESLQETSECTQAETQCLSSNAGRCELERKTYECLNDLSDHAPAALLDTRIDRIEDFLVNSCDPHPGEKGCVAGDMKCTSGSEVRNLMGFPVARDCWQYEQAYTCLGDGTNAYSDCGPFQNDPSCEIIGQTCLSFDDADEEIGATPNTCQHWEYRYRCGGGLGLPQQCTATNVCVGNLCEGVEEEPNTDFAMAAAWLTMLDEAAKDSDKSLDAQNIQLFAGEPMRCSRRALSYGDCCRDSGWGVGLFMQCRESEFALMDRKRAKAAHYVGTYCSRKFLGVCITRQRAYCGFNSQMGRVFQKEIRRQTGLSWGRSRSPDCSGLYLDQIEDIDWEAIDLSEAFADMMNSANAPSAANVMQRLQQNLNLAPGQVSAGD